MSSFSTANFNIFIFTKQIVLLCDVQTNLIWSVLFYSSLLNVHQRQTVRASRKKKLIQLCLTLFMHEVYFQHVHRWKEGRRTFGFVTCHHNTPSDPQTPTAGILPLSWFILKLCRIKTGNIEPLVTWLLFCPNLGSFGDEINQHLSSFVQCFERQSSRGRYMASTSPL